MSTSFQVNRRFRQLNPNYVLPSRASQMAFKVSPLVAKSTHLTMSYFTPYCLPSHRTALSSNVWGASV